MKKSFMIYKDSLAVLDDLDDQQCGELFRAIKAHQLDEDFTPSPIVKIAFSSFKGQFTRDDEKYEKLCEKNRLIAVNRHKRPVTKSTTGNQPIPVVTKSTDKDKDKDKDKEKDSNKTLDQSALDREFENVWIAYGKKGNKKTSLAKYSKLTAAKKQLLNNRIPDYVFSTPEKQYRKNLETYINQECWNDEVTTHEENKRTTQSGRPSVVDRVRAVNEQREQARRVEERALDGQAMGETPGNLRPPAEQPVRGNDAGELGEIIDGDYTRAD